jgi:hypothetical protein
MLIMCIVILDDRSNTFCIDAHIFGVLQKFKNNVQITSSFIVMCDIYYHRLLDCHGMLNRQGNKKDFYQRLHYFFYSSIISCVTLFL